METCKLNGVDPQAYLADVISRVVSGYPQSRLDELLPWAYPTIQLALSASLTPRFTKHPHVTWVRCSA